MGYTKSKNLVELKIELAKLVEQHANMVEKLDNGEKEFEKIWTQMCKLKEGYVPRYVTLAISGLTGAFGFAVAVIISMSTG